MKWLNPLFLYGRKHDLEEKDLYNVLPEDHSEPLADRLERFWRKEVQEAHANKKKPRLINSIKKTFGWAYFYYAPHCLFLSIIIRVLQPLTLGYLIRHFDSQSQTTVVEAYMLATAVVGMAVLQAIVGHHSSFGTLQIGMQLRVACSSLIYRKMLRLARTSDNRTTGGLIINLLSNDVARFDLLFVFLHYIWVMPLQVAAITYLIWENVKVASLAGVFLIIVQTIPVQAYCGKLTSQFRSKVSTRTDERVLLMSEIINGIRVIKMYTWERPFELAVSLARKYEIDVLTTKSYLKGVNTGSFVFTERTTLYFTIIAYVLGGKTIYADVAFTLAQYFNILQLTMAIFYPMAISAAAEANVSVKRIEKFLLLDEFCPNQKPISENTDNKKVLVKAATASWTGNSIVNTLHEINVNMMPKKLYAVIGPVGSGKSSFLKLILGELKASSGQVFAYGKISYASQEPWLFPSSVRNNILFDEPYDEKKYAHVTKVCTLTKDFEQLPHGDKTLVGERGAALSGGQCARVNLARAIYKDADIYLFDDPLSAVDTHVGKHLFEDCINGFLKDKTRVLVTHQTQYLKDVDWIILINNGKLEFQGTYEDFQKNDQITKNLPLNDDKSERSLSEAASLNVSLSESLVSNFNANENEEEPQETAELMSKGNVAKSLIWKYWKTGGSYFFILATLLCVIIAQIVTSGCDYWLKHWVKQNQLKSEYYISLNLSSTESTLVGFSNSNSTLIDGVTESYSGLDLTLAENVTEIPSNFSVTESFFNVSQSDNQTLDFLANGRRLNTSEYFSDGEPVYFLEDDTAMLVYTSLILGTIIFSVVKNVLVFKICMTASKNLHNKMFASLLRAPMRFFDLNPSGRILNRFSKDIGAVDESLPVAMIDALQIFSVMIGIMTQVLIIYWWTIFPMIIMGYLYAKIRNIYLATVQDVKRLEGNAKSPVFSHTNSSLSGLLTIRSCSAQRMLSKEFDMLQDAHTSAYYLIIATSSAFGFWLDMVSVGFVAFVTYSFIIVDSNDTFAGDVGLAVSQVLILCGMLQYGMRQTAEMVSQMTSVERIFEFTKLPQEGPFESEPGHKPPSSWPAAGKIKFEKLYLKYDDEAEPVLKNLNFTIDSGSKVGIVGRTGAGKSSLISALFRLSNIDGLLSIDDLGISKIGLKDLRCKISIIPQEPMLFTSSLRNNIDPFEEFKDEELWDAIKNVELDKAFTSLNHPIERSGSNLSAGQRQLLCLARAIVKKNKILILDEATANVDPATDSLIQKTIRSKFVDCTVLTIAHRLNTVMDSDKVLVMESGEAVEFDHPHILLQKNDGYLTKMVEQTGEAMAEQLRKMAEKAYPKIVKKESQLEISEIAVQKDETKIDIEDNDASEKKVIIEDDTVSETKIDIEEEAKVDTDIEDTSKSETKLDIEIDNENKEETIDNKDSTETQDQD